MWLFNTICVFISHLPSQLAFFTQRPNKASSQIHLIIAAVWGHVELTATFPVDRRGVNPKMMDHDPSYEVWSRNHGRISIHWISQTVSSQTLCHKLLVKLDLRWICSPCFYEYMFAVCRALLFTQWISGLSQAQMVYPSLCQEWFWQLFRGYFSLMAMVLDRFAPECWQLSLLPHIIRSPSVKWSLGAAFCTQSAALPGDVARGTRGEVLETQGGGWRAGSVARKFLKRGSLSETKRGHFISIHANLG